MPDRLSALPDELLQHVLGFLPAHEAVRTSVLSPRWRNLWKSVRRLHITCPVDDCYRHDNEEPCLLDFVNHLILLRDRVSLDEVKFDYRSLHLEEETGVWVQHALLCQVQVLIVNIDHIDDFNWITLESPRPASRHLRVLELNEVSLKGKFLDFSSCPALEVLKIRSCDVQTKMILSPSVKVLSIEDSYFEDDYRTHISVPNLIWLHLSHSDGIAPLLESMPLLETATIKSNSLSKICQKDSSRNYCGSCAACCGDDDHKGRCVLLGGLSSAVNLELTAHSSTSLVFRRDLIWCPTFSKLKTLLLNDWCLHFDLFPLVCILNHSPILENLTLYLNEGLQFPTQMEGNNTTTEKPAALSQHLKIIKIVCRDINDRICEIIKYLSTWDVEISIKRKNEVPGYW